MIPRQEIEACSPTATNRTARTTRVDLYTIECLVRFRTMSERIKIVPYSALVFRCGNNPAASGGWSVVCCHCSSDEEKKVIVSVKNRRVRNDGARVLNASMMVCEYEAMRWLCKSVSLLSRTRANRVHVCVRAHTPLVSQITSISIHDSAAGIFLLSQ